MLTISIHFCPLLTMSGRLLPKCWEGHAKSHGGGEYGHETSIGVAMAMALRSFVTVVT